jgi:hypothetical protein
MGAIEMDITVCLKTIADASIAVGKEYTVSVAIDVLTVGSGCHQVLSPLGRRAEAYSPRVLTSSTVCRQRISPYNVRHISPKLQLVSIGAGERERLLVYSVPVDPPASSPLAPTSTVISHDVKANRSNAQLDIRTCMLVSVCLSVVRGNYRCCKKNFTIIFEMLLCGECYEDVCI